MWDHPQKNKHNAFVPDKPTNLTVTSITSRKVAISWLDPKNLGGYRLSRFWITLKEESALILNITTGKMNEYEINNLIPYTTYGISVAAGNYLGFGEETVTSFITSEEAPSGPPSHIKTTSRSASLLSVIWDPPEKAKQNGVIVSYTACVSHSENGLCFQTFITRGREWLVGNLNSSTKYYVRVLASTKVGHGNYSESKGFFTNGTFVPDKPTNLTITSITSRKVAISWLDPKNLGGYRLSRFWIKLKEESALILNITTGKMNEYEINNLIPYTTYGISVAAGNYLGFGEETVTSFITSEE
ncbi:tyrosine- phosphatase Lar isoform X1, partial [Paramuricea clavata]